MTQLHDKIKDTRNTPAQYHYFSDADLGRIGISSPIPALNLRQKADGQGA